MILDSASRLSSHLPSNVSTSLQSDLNYYMHLRKQICELMAYTRCYIARYLAIVLKSFQCLGKHCSWHRKDQCSCCIGLAEGLTFILNFLWPVLFDTCITSPVFLPSN